MSAVEKTEVTTLPPRRSVLVDMATRFGMEPAAFEATVRATCMPPGKEAAATREQFAAFLLVAKEHGLNPLTKEIYAFPAKGGGITPVVGIDGWANIINSHPAFDGMDFEDRVDGNGAFAAITCRIHRKDRSHPIEATEYLSECRRQTEPWRVWPRRMLRHKAMIQAARYAFGFAGVYDPDEAERIAGDMARPVASAPPKTLTARLDLLAADPPHDPETGEITEPAGETPANEALPSNGTAANAPPNPADGAARQVDVAVVSPSATSTEAPSAAPETASGWQGEEGAPQPSPAALARQRGREARTKGMARKAVPPEFRDASRLDEATAWQQGWDEAA